MAGDGPTTLVGHNKKKVKKKRIKRKLNNKNSKKSFKILLKTIHVNTGVHVSYLRLKLEGWTQLVKYEKDLRLNWQKKKILGLNWLNKKNKRLNK